MPQRIRSIATVLTALALASCGSYDFTINEKVVYSPKPLFSDFSLPDPALHRCVEQAVTQGKITKAGDLEILNCSHAGITDLEGLELFTGLSKLKLSFNKVQDIAALSALSKLEVLQLDTNHIVDARPLLQISALRELNLSANPQLICSSAQNVIALDILELPRHCQ